MYCAHFNREYFLDAELDVLSLERLQELCEKLDLRKSGAKEDIVQRLSRKVRVTRYPVQKQDVVEIAEKEYNLFLKVNSLKDDCCDALRKCEERKEKFRVLRDTCRMCAKKDKKAKHSKKREKDFEDLTFKVDALALKVEKLSTAA